MTDVPQIDPAEASQLIADGAFVLDVREDDEWEAGHSGSAHHVPLGDVPARVAEVPTEGVVVVICRVGGRSQKAAEFLRTQGVDARNLDGGMRAWDAAGLDVVTASGERGSVI